MRFSFPFVWRSQMVSAVNAETERWAKQFADMSSRYGRALQQVIGLEKQLSAWVRNEPGDITPRQMAQMFYAQDDQWQADFFNCLQGEIEAIHASGNEMSSPGVPAGEAQWWHVAKRLNDSGFESIEAMYQHAAHHRTGDGNMGW